MKILADENIPEAKSLFSKHGKVSTFEGRDLDAKRLEDVDALLVRSITPITQQLLKDSNVKFVGTATIGTDHVDMDWLKQQGINFSNAPGCNAIAVAEYVLSGLFVISTKYNLDLRTVKVGIIGAGNVGSALATRLGILGIPYGIYDPPLADAGDSRTMMTEEELSDCDILSFHVPLTNSEQSNWPTKQLVNLDYLSKMSALKYLFNTCRGAVFKTDDIKSWLAENNERQCIIDVWENEPNIDTELLQKCLLGTPHIAGHSYEGKVRGTIMLYQAFCKCFDLDCQWDRDKIFGKNLPKDVIQLQQDLNFMQATSSAIWKVYNITDDDKALRAGMKRDLTSHFDRLRKGYKVRRECTAHRLDELTVPDGSLRTLKQLGFKS